MRLNESSMDKLFDLMTMGFKHQVGQISYFPAPVSLVSDLDAFRSFESRIDGFVMTLRVQLMHCSYPGQLLHVTLNHLSLLKSIADSDQISQLIGM